MGSDARWTGYKSSEGRVLLVFVKKALKLFFLPSGLLDYVEAAVPFVKVHVADDVVPMIPSNLLDLLNFFQMEVVLQ